MTVGKLYNVNVTDCCASLSFVSRLRSVERDTEDEEPGYSTYVFENGIRLTSLGIEREAVEVKE